MWSYSNWKVDCLIHLIINYYDSISYPTHTLLYFSDRNGKLLTCFDINSNDSILCAGTEHSQSESYLLFFDTRQRSSLGVYQESHRDDLTQIKFHTTAQNLLASGSTDGLINVFNISETTEDDALQYCLNTENSVQTLNWHPTSDPNKNRISCITHTNDFHLYDVEESEEIVKFKRDDITNLIKRKSSNECYLVNCHTTGNSDVLLVAGSNYKKGECLRTLTLHGKDFLPRNNLGDNKQIVRCSFYSDKVSFISVTEYYDLRCFSTLWVQSIFVNYIFCGTE